MPLALYELVDWNPVPRRLPKVSEFTYVSGDIAPGHPTAIVFIATHNYVDAGIMLFGVGAEGGASGAGVTVTLGPNVGLDEDPDGIHYICAGGPVTFEPPAHEDGEGLWNATVPLHVFAPTGEAPAYVSMQVSWPTISLSTDDPPTGAPDGILPPTNLTAETIDDHVHLEWVDQADNETGFVLEWSTVPAASWAAFAVLPANVTSFDDYSIAPGEEYSYRVYAFKSDKRSIDSNIATTSGQPLVLSPTEGPTGGRTAFTITGTFDPEAINEVTFGGKDALDVSATETEVTGLTPSHAEGLVDVVVTRGSRVDTLSDAFEYTAGNLFPRLQVSEPQNFAAPMPSPVTLSAEVVDDNQGLFENCTFAWELVSAPSQEASAGVLINDADEAECTAVVTVFVQGVYLFRVTATGVDTIGNAATITNIAQVTLPAARVPRVFSASYDTTYPDAVTVNPAIEDDGWSGSLRFEWTQAGGPGTATIATPNARMTSITFPNTPGTYSFKLSVSNDRYTGSGIVKVVNYTSVLPTEEVATELTLTINGVDY